MTANRAVYHVSRHWLFLFNLVIALYAALPFAAPVLMHIGADGPARVVYAIYSPACHQMGFRSWFLYGEQYYYPLEVAGLSQVRSFEEYVVDTPEFEGMDSLTDFARFSWEARSFVGDERMGYKVALCQRDVATYLSLLLGGLLFALLRDRVRPLPWQLYLPFGVLPMALDGGYQLITRLMPNVLPVHETDPLLRTITGALFGFGLAWLTYPHIHEGMKETELAVRDKLLRTNLIKRS